MTTVRRRAAAGDDGGVHRFAGDLVVRLVLAAGEIARRQAAGFVEDVDQHVGAVGRQTLAADGWSSRVLAKMRAASLNFTASLGITGGVPVSSMEMNLTFFEPITAPRPPRPRLRMRDSGSATEILAESIFISPTGPMAMTPTGEP